MVVRCLASTPSLPTARPAATTPTTPWAPSMLWGSTSPTAPPCPASRWSPPPSSTSGPSPITAAPPGLMPFCPAASPWTPPPDGTDWFGTPLLTDQRDVARPQGSAFDVGAYESARYAWSGVLQPLNPDGSSVFKAGSTVSVKFQLTGASASL